MAGSHLDDGPGSGTDTWTGAGEGCTNVGLTSAVSRGLLWDLLWLLFWGLFLGGCELLWLLLWELSLVLGFRVW